MSDLCAVCKVRFRSKNQRAKRNPHLPQHEWMRKLLERDCVLLDDDSRICMRCYHQYVRKRPRSDDDPEIAVEHNDSHSDSDNTAQRIQIPLITIEDVRYGGCSHKKCLFCRAILRRGTSCILPVSLRHHILFTYRVWCPADVRICSEHILGNELDPDVDIAIDEMPVIDLPSLSPERLKQIMNDLLLIAHTASQPVDKPRLHYSTLSDDEYLAWSGWSRDQFNGIHQCARPHMKSNCLCSEDSVLLFWVKLKTNLSWAQLSSMFNIKIKKVSQVFHEVSEAIYASVVPKHLGIQHIQHDDALQHNTTFTRTFYGDKVTLILDGTYIYINKSSHHQFQRASYGGQKKTNYLKFMSVVFPNGYVLDSIGPYYGSFNDASITKDILSQFDILKSWMDDGDVLIVDRGFRDVIDLLSDLGYDTKMPSFLSAGKSQHDSLQANMDRQCTKTRWVVESYHGRLKKWRFFKETLTSNYFITIIKQLVKIVTACLNGFRGPIYVTDADKDAKDRTMAQKMMTCLYTNNELCERIENDSSLTSRSKKDWVKLEALQMNFPQLDMEYLETLTCGSYQLKMASGYIQEHLTEDGDFEVLVHQNSQNILRGKIQSRHKSQTKYHVWIEFTFNDTQNPITQYYCTCPAGKRTTGMCAHISSILLYMGHMKVSDRKLQPHCSQFSQCIV